MKKPKLRKLPKRPAKSASNERLKNYFAKVEEVNDSNRIKMKEYREKIAEHKKLVGALSGVKHHNWGMVKTYTRKPSVKKHKRRVSGVKKHRRKKSRR
jgi:hypothetical protein